MERLNYGTAHYDDHEECPDHHDDYQEGHASWHYQDPDHDHEGQDHADTLQEQHEQVGHQADYAADNGLDLISMPSSDGGARRVIARGAGSCHRTYEDSRCRCLCGWQTSRPGPRQAQRRRGTRRHEPSHRGRTPALTRLSMGADAAPAFGDVSIPSTSGPTRSAPSGSPERRWSSRQNAAAQSPDCSGDIQLVPE